jgi:5-methylcytosine-specific restriction enzyme A
MTLRPCIVCGDPSDRSRCTQHRPKDTKAPAATRGYHWQWTKLSQRARRLQPFCCSCGSVEDLQADHKPQAWARKAAGKSIRLRDIDVVCGPCNRARGAARGNAPTRGDAPPEALSRPLGKAQGALHTSGGALESRS